MNIKETKRTGLYLVGNVVHVGVRYTKISTVWYTKCSFDNRFNFIEENKQTVVVTDLQITNKPVTCKQCLKIYSDEMISIKL